VTTRRNRLIVLTNLANYHIPGVNHPEQSPIIIAPARAVMTRTLPRREFLKETRNLKPGKIIQIDEIIHRWVKLGYEPVTTVISPGQFARRGGILDVWPPAESNPSRIEFFGDEIDTLRHFDPATQRTMETQESIQITPAREFLIRSNDHSKNSAVPEYSEFHIPLLHTIPASVFDYLPRQSIVLFDDNESLIETVHEVEEAAVSLRRDYVDEGIIPKDFPTPYLTWSEIDDTLAGHYTLDLGPSTATEKIEPAPKFTSSPRFGGRLKLVMDHLNQRNTSAEPIFVVSRQSARLEELWSENSISSEITSAEQTPIHFVEGSLSEGWIFSPVEDTILHLLTDGELFGWRRPEPRVRYRPVAESPEAAYADLEVGNWVVHIDHGVGLFVDLVHRTVDDIEREYLCIEYAEGDQLFVPVYQADRLTRYIGPNARHPSLTRLGGVEWRNIKSRVKEAVQEVAEDLLDLYAKRNVVKGHAFALDSPWQAELEASFPYIETDDQLRVLAEVKADMEAPKPMDRLICGDVGYGKTEVALRSAFKAVMDGKQVAILVPTTVLAQQHYYTFRQRLSAFPVEVEMLSRFRTQQQQREILNRLVQGSVDIVIGTHRLIQGDVMFKELGLLIIDEEQRFGVTHKETLKKMRTEVDVLTMTATPIPRTLYMTLTGIRDISTINTPPEERLPIITHVGPYSKRLIRQAILRELERGGQVFFVHNRVQTIEGIRNHLERLIPEARISVAHGQMAETELSQRMQAFNAGDVDVLLSTSIIESGLDIPNANTLIVDRADTFGLAQLYQLRGRVGRGAQRAYAYFFRHRRRPPTQEGHQRLETIAENPQLGAGFSIAMRDLEIRGAGDILGNRQHGHIAAVGFHLYTRLLGDAVQRLHPSADVSPLPPTLQIPAPLPVSVDLPLAVNIPHDYVSDRDVRLRLYRRIADLRTIDEVSAMREEFSDRFGPLPMEAENLFFQIKIKLMAENAGIASISGENSQVVLRYPPLSDGVKARDIPSVGLDVRTGKNALWMQILEKENWREILVKVLHKLGKPNP
jgi:transcription-repair coupling factor (superfamily II helicase)